VSEKGMWAWHVHHEILVEHLEYPMDDRVWYIKHHKPVNEREVRLKLLKIVEDQEKVGLILEHFINSTFYQDRDLSEFFTDPDLLALHAKECPNCPWNGETIFPKFPKKEVVS
jgi:hypothetical protein